MATKIIAIRVRGDKPEHIEWFKTETGDTYARSEMVNKVNQGEVFIVNHTPYPKLETAKSANGNEYVRSMGDYTTRDNLMKLPSF